MAASSRIGNDETEEIERLTAVSRSRTEPASGVSRAQGCCWPIANPSFLMRWGKASGPPSNGSALRGGGRLGSRGPLAAIEIDHGGAKNRSSRRRPKPGWCRPACDKAKEHGYPHELWTAASRRVTHASTDRRRGTNVSLGWFKARWCEILGQEIKPHGALLSGTSRCREFEQKMAEVLCVYREVRF